MEPNDRSTRDASHRLLPPWHDLVSTALAIDGSEATAPFLEAARLAGLSRDLPSEALFTFLGAVALSDPVERIPLLREAEDLSEGYQTVVRLLADVRFELIRALVSASPDTVAEGIARMPDALKMLAEFDDQQAHAKRGSLHTTYSDVLRDHAEIPRALAHAVRARDAYQRADQPQGAARAEVRVARYKKELGIS